MSRSPQCRSLDKSSHPSRSLVALASAHPPPPPRRSLESNSSAPSLLSTAPLASSGVVSAKLTSLFPNNATPLTSSCGLPSTSLTSAITSSATLSSSPTSTTSSTHKFVSLSSLSSPSVGRGRPFPATPRRSPSPPAWKRFSPPSQRRNSPPLLPRRPSLGTRASLASSACVIRGATAKLNGKLNVSIQTKTRHLIPRIALNNLSSPSSSSSASEAAIKTSDKDSHTGSPSVALNVYEPVEAVHSTKAAAEPPSVATAFVATSSLCSPAPVHSLNSITTLGNKPLPHIAQNSIPTRPTAAPTAVPLASCSVSSSCIHPSHSFVSRSNDTIRSSSTASGSQQPCCSPASCPPASVPCTPAPRPSSPLTSSGASSPLTSSGASSPVPCNGSASSTSSAVTDSAVANPIANVNKFMRRLPRAKRKQTVVNKYCEEMNQLNEVANNRPRSALIHSIQQENRYIRELQEENKELRLALEEQQNVMELIMSKYREQVAKLLSSGPDVHSADNTAMQRKLGANIERVSEMVLVMRRAAQLDDDQSHHYQQLVTTLARENRGLREMLQIAIKSGSVSHPETLNADTQTVDTNTDTIKLNPNFIQINAQQQEKEQAEDTLVVAHTPPTPATEEQEQQNDDQPAEDANNVNADINNTCPEVKS